MAHKLVDFEEQDNRLVIRLIPERRAEVEKIVLEEKMRAKDRTLWDDLARICEYQIANGWDFVDPDEIDAMTEAPILAYGAVRDDHGHITGMPDPVYWFERYQIEDPVEVLIEKGEVTFPAAKEIEQ